MTLQSVWRKIKRTEHILLSAGVFFLVIAIPFAGVAGWYYYEHSCEADAVTETSALLIAQMSHYDDVYISATNGTRDSIDYPVNVMQQILMNTQEIKVPACLRTARDELIDYMRNVVHAFQAFRNEESDDAVKGYLDESYAHVRVFLSELKRVKGCAPYCMP